MYAFEETAIPERIPTRPRLVNTAPVGEGRRSAYRSPIDQVRIPTKPLWGAGGIPQASGAVHIPFRLAIVTTRSLVVCGCFALCTRVLWKAETTLASRNCERNGARSEPRDHRHHVEVTEALQLGTVLTLPSLKMQDTAPLERAAALLRQQFSTTCASIDIELERRQEALWLHLSYTPIGEAEPRRLSHVVAAVEHPKEAAVRIAVRSALDELRSGIEFAASLSSLPGEAAGVSGGLAPDAARSAPG